MKQHNRARKTRKPGKAAAFHVTSVSKRKSAPPRAKSLPQFKSKMQAVEDEVALLTSYSSDTVYQLHYESMKYHYISPAVTRLLGFSAEEMKRVNFRSLILETRIVTDGMKTVGSFEELEETRRGGDVNKWEADYLIRTKDGRQIWVSDVSYPWFDETGAIIGSVGSLRDITKRMEIESRTIEELEKIANTDALTGIANRREFFTELERELKRIDRTEEEAAILLIDIDHFKQVNDTYGHDIGDKVLIEVVDVLKQCMRETDMIARLGGEEFGVLLPDTSIKGSYWVAERMRLAVARHVFAMGTDQTISCSVSVGIAGAMPGSQAQASDLYKLADTRLYIAKNTGRNQVSIDDVIQTH